MTGSRSVKTRIVKRGEIQTGLGKGEDVEGEGEIGRQVVGGAMCDVGEVRAWTRH